MSIHKRDKRSRYRGSHTHGKGSKKKRRGAGNRGGKGRAGLGKRGGQKVPSRLKEGVYTLGTRGFYRHGQKEEIKGINLEELNKNLDRLVSENKVEKKGDIYLVDLEKLGCNKLLGSGKIGFKLHIKADYVSKKAEEKIKAAGGKILSEAKE